MVLSQKILTLLDQLVSEGHARRHRYDNDRQPGREEADLQEGSDVAELGQLFGDAREGVVEHERKYQVGEDVREVDGVEVGIPLLGREVLDASVLDHDDDGADEEEQDRDDPHWYHDDLDDLGLFDAFKGEGSSDDEEDDEPKLEGVEHIDISHQFGKHSASHDAFWYQHSEEVDGDGQHRDREIFLSEENTELLTMIKCCDSLWMTFLWCWLGVHQRMVLLVCCRNEASVCLRSAY